MLPALAVLPDGGAGVGRATDMKIHLERGVVFVWEGRLDAPDPLAGRARMLLSEDERVRADRFRVGIRRRRFTLARVRLRGILGRLTERSPGEIRFGYEDGGKPFLVDGPSFNLSHSGERMLVAVSLEGRLGVDLEEVRPVRNLGALAERHFAESEAACLRAVQNRERTAVFFRIWTRREAFLKALGRGLAAPLLSFSVNPLPDPLEGLVRVEDPAENPRDWHVGGLDCAPGAEAAVALDRKGISVAPLPFHPDETWM